MAKSDTTLVRRACAGEREAFARLVERHAGPSYGIALAILGDDGEAEELVQDIGDDALALVETERRALGFLLEQTDSIAAYEAGLARPLDTRASAGG